jgi:hypothetical protein
VIEISCCVRRFAYLFLILFCIHLRSIDAFLEKYTDSSCHGSGGTSKYNKNNNDDGQYAV